MHRAWPGAAAPLQSIGWLLDPDTVEGDFEHENSGTISGNGGPFSYQYLFGGVVGEERAYGDSARPIEWIFTWESPDGTGPPTHNSEGNYFQVDLPGFFGFTGLLTVQASIDGELSDKIEISFSKFFYTDIAWGPAPT